MDLLWCKEKMKRSMLLSPSTYWVSVSFVFIIMHSYIPKYYAPIFIFTMVFRLVAVNTVNFVPNPWCKVTLYKVYGWCRPWWHAWWHVWLMTIVYSVSYDWEKCLLCHAVSCSQLQVWGGPVIAELDALQANRPFDATLDCADSSRLCRCIAWQHRM